MFSTAVQALVYVLASRVEHTPAALVVLRTILFEIFKIFVNASLHLLGGLLGSVVLGRIFDLVFVFPLCLLANSRVILKELLNSGR